MQGVSQELRSSCGARRNRMRTPVRFGAAVLTAALSLGQASTVLAAGDGSKFNTVADACADNAGGNACNVAAMTPVRWDSAAVRPTQLPWPAPVGHRQPRAIDFPDNEPLSRFDLDQRRLDKEIDRKLRICRGC